MVFANFGRPKMSLLINGQFYKSITIFLFRTKSDGVMDWNDWNDHWKSEGDPFWQEYEVNRVLKKTLNPRVKSVFVPLCGKTLDMIWLQEQGCRVVGVEFNKDGITEFFEQNDIDYKKEGNTYESTNLEPKITIHCRDLFAEVAPTEAAQDPEGC